MSDPEMLEVCPDCSSSKIYKRKPAFFDTNRSGDTPYVCMMCGYNFHKPDERESKGHGDAFNGKPRKLLDADADDYPR